MLNMQSDRWIYHIAENLGLPFPYVCCEHDLGMYSVCMLSVSLKNHPHHSSHSKHLIRDNVQQMCKTATSKEVLMSTFHPDIS